MSVLSPEYEDRLYHWIFALKKDLYRPIAPIDWEAFFTMDYLPLSEAKKHAFSPVEPGLVWGHTWEYCWLHGQAAIPASAAGERINLDACLGGEATIFVNDQAFGTYRADWIDEPHHYIEDNTLTRSAEAGEVFDIYIELYAGHWFPRNVEREGHTVTGPVMEGDYGDPLTEGARRTLGRATYGIWNETAYQLYMDVATLKSLLDVLDPDSLRAVKVAQALEEFTLTVDFEQDQKGRNRDYARARQLLAPVLAAHNGSTVPKFYAIGNAHIDLAWLWPMQETYRKIARTLGAQLRHLEEYPEYKYIHSQPAAFEMCRKYYPELFERIRAAVKEGRFLVEGAMWVEPDTNLTSGESLIRQLFYGKKYYKDTFGVDSEVLWLPDSFGYSGALPQILNNFDVKYLVTQKIFWSYNAGESFPYHYFTWEGIDGSQIDTFLPTSYIYRTTPAEANKVWRKRSQRKDLEAFLFPYGYGDGGGGPCRDHIEYVKRSQQLEGNVEMKFAGPNEFFHDMEALGGPKHRYVGELYFTAHRGTYTSQAMVKRNNRRSEFLMHDLETWGALAQLKGLPYDEASAESMWKTILLHQFHDILPGSCIGRVYEEAKPVYEELFSKGEGWIQKSLGQLLDISAPEANAGITLFNSLGFTRRALIHVPESFAGGAIIHVPMSVSNGFASYMPKDFADGAYADGCYIPVHKGLEGYQALVTLPSYGAISLIPADAAKGSITKAEAPNAAMPNASGTKDTSFAVPSGALAARTISGYMLENSKVRFLLDENGQVISCHLKTADGSLGDREFAFAPMNHFLLYKDVPRKYDAWDIDSNYIDQEVPQALCVESLEIVQAQGLEAVLRLKGRISNSTFTQLIRLEAEATRLTFETRINWQEKHRLLKVAFPVNVYAQNAFHEIQFGYAERPTHRSNVYDQQRFEVCNHRYTALVEANHGAAVLNDCKYGVSVNDHAIELTLLRAATCPDPNADRGEHTFTYAFTAWEGSFMDSDVVRQGYELNVQPQIATGCMSSFSAFTVSAPNVILETVKPASDGSGDLILRLYESKKAETFASLSVDLSAFGLDADSYEIFETNMPETANTPVDANRLHFHPYEVRTLRIAIRK